MKALFLSLLLLMGTAQTLSAKQQLIVSNVDEESIDLDEEIPFIPEEEIALEAPKLGVHIDLGRVFSGAPIIYMLLLTLSMTAVMLFLYTILRWRTLGAYSSAYKKTLTHQLEQAHYNEVYLLCKDKKDLLSRMLTSALTTKDNTKSGIEEVMQREATRATSATWQRISILNDIALIAPMLGLMGTVLGMFFAFYDMNRSLDTITKLFDGLGISVGTTVAGLIVALLALMLHTFCKHRLVRRLSLVEQESAQIVALLTQNRGE